MQPTTKQPHGLLRYALVQTVPVLCGYGFLGMAFGILLQQAGYGWPWALLISTVVYAGSMQFAMVGMFTGGVSLFTAAAMTFAINGRHIFYGFSFLQKFKEMGKARPYMIFSLTDETYSLLCSLKPPPGMDEKRLMLAISLLDQCYWVAGSLAGALVGQALPFDATGIDFAMTALFTVIFVEQWLGAKGHLPALVGLVCGGVCLAALGPNRFLLPALVSAVAVLLGTARWVEPAEKGERDR